MDNNFFAILHHFRENIYGYVEAGVYMTVAVLVVGCVWCLSRSGRLPADKKTVFITGCDSGFGERLARRLSQLGYHVIAGCLSRHSNGAQQLASLSNVDVIECDVTSDKAVEEARLFVERHLKENDRVLWGVVNNAGIAEVGLFEWTPLESFRRIHDVNTLGTVRVLLAMLPFVRRCRGRVVNVASQAGLFSPPGGSAYSMTKHAVVAMSNSMRLELAQFGVRVCIIQPTAYKTSIADYDGLSKIIVNHWTNCEEEIKRAYGLESLAALCETFRANLVNSTRTNIDEVVDDMIHALNAKYPHSSYDCHWTTTCLKYLLVHILPTWITDYVLAKA